MSEPCCLRRGEGNEARDDEKQNKFQPHLPEVQTGTMCTKSTVDASGEGSAEVPRWGGCLSFYAKKCRCERLQIAPVPTKRKPSSADKKICV